MSDDKFKWNVRFCYEERDDPTRFTGWDEERCKALMPAFYEAWSKVQIYTKLAKLAVRAEAADVGD